MEKSVEISILLEIYGKLLTEKQYDLLDNYYNNDFSLSEIAENEGITRQAVRDNLKKGENNLYEYEEKLEIMKSRKESEEKLNKAFDKLNKISSKMTDEEIKKVISEARSEM